MLKKMSFGLIEIASVAAVVGEPMSLFESDSDVFTTLDAEGNILDTFLYVVD
jgi:hypothetical protein